MLFVVIVLFLCGEYNKLLKSIDYEYKYEVVKNYFVKGQYNWLVILLNELIIILKGGDKVEELLYMLVMSYYNQKDYFIVVQLFIIYFNIYLCGQFFELVCFYVGKVLFLDILEF